MTAPLVRESDRKPLQLIMMRVGHGREHAHVGVPGQLWERTAERAVKAEADAAEVVRVNALLDTVLGEEPKL